MTHLSEEQLILHYYGEEPDSAAGFDSLAAERHLETCDECRVLYGSLQRVLNVVDSLPVPVRGPEYGAQVWQRIEHRIPARRSWFSLPSPWRWTAAGAAFASLLVAAFLAGRFYPQASRPDPPARFASASSADAPPGERILLVGVGDYLERSQMVLVELANANPKGSLDISFEQERAADLVGENRLYRQAAAHSGNPEVASLLDDLDRILLEISHAPSRISPEELESLRRRLEGEGILFKIRVLGTTVRNQEEPSAGTPRHKL